MLRKTMLTAALLAIAGGLASAGAAARDWNDHGNNGGSDSRYDSRDGRRDHDRRDHDRRDERRWNDARRHDHGHYDRSRGWAPRYLPAPRYYGHAPRREGWREPYARGYRYWRNDRYYYAEPGRPAVELRFVVPLR